MMEFIGYVFSFIGVGLKWLGDTISANLASFVSALLGTFFGAYFAFVFERRERKDDVEARNVAALNRALFTLSEMWSILHQYQRDHLEPFRDRPDRWLNLTSHPLAAQHYGLQFEAGQLFFLLSKAGNTLARVMLQERRFKLAIGLIEHRTKLMLDQVFTRMGEAQVPLNQDMRLADVEAIVGIATAHQLRQYTDQIFRFVDADVPDLEAIYNELRAAAERLYPEEEFIRFDFNPPPREPGERPI